MLLTLSVFSPYARSLRAYLERVHPFDQSSYQVRFEWGKSGLERLAPADVVVVVDVLRFSSTAAARVAAGDQVPVADLLSRSINGAPLSLAAGALDHAPVVLAGALRNASAVAHAVREIQSERGARTSVAVIASGEASAAGDVRFAVEDQLGAGAVIAALSECGVDHCSPEAVAASESFRALRGAVRHLLTASGSGRELAARDRQDDVRAAATIDDLDIVPRLRDGVFGVGTEPI